MGERKVDRVSRALAWLTDAGRGVLGWWTGAGHWVLFPLTSPVLLVVARTWRGRAAALVVQFLWLYMGTLVVVFAASAGRRPPWLPALGGLGFVGIVLAITAFARAADRHAVADPGGGVEAHFLGPAWYRPGGWAFAPLPESDFLRLAAAVVTRFDPLMEPEDGRRVRARLAELLAEMDADPVYARLPSVLCFMTDSVGREPAHGHYFSYTPAERVPGERFGLLVALHGHGGNFHLWLHAWRPFADAHRFVVACPSFGYGNWEHPGGVPAVRRCLDHAVRRLPVDPARVVLAGISQGGAGVGRAGAAFPGRFAGLVFLSPTLEPDVLDSPAFADGWKGRPVLVVHGGMDHNVTPEAVNRGVEVMRRNGVAVAYHFDPDAGHFLFFEKAGEVRRAIGDWLG